MPILNNILFEAEPGKTRLFATNLEVGISSEIKVDVKEKGGVAIPARKFGDIIQSLPSEGQIEINADSSNKISIIYPKIKFRIFGLPTSDFPLPPEPKKGVTFNLKASTIRDMIGRVIYAASHEVTRPGLNGACFDIDGTQIQMVATDGHRLAYLRISEKTKIDKRRTITIPVKALNEISKILAEDSEDVSITITDNQIVMNFKDTTLFSRLISEEFPNYDKILKKKFEKTVKIPTESFKESVRRIALLSTEKANPVKLKVSNNQIIIISVSPDAGEAEEESAADYQGAEFQIVVNSNYLIDVLKTISTEKAEIHVIDPASQIMVTPAGVSDQLCMVMPIRI